MISPRKAVEDMDNYVPPTSDREDYIRLDFNENTVGCSPKVINELKKVQKSSLNIYPEYSQFRKELAKFAEVDAKEILATNATDEAIKTVIETFVEKNDEVIIPVPTFAMFKFYSQLGEAKINEVKYDDDLSFPTSKVLDSINEKTKLVIIANPNSPTGTVIKNKELVGIIEECNKNNSLVLVDEAYFQFYGKSAISFINKYDNLILTRTFSKIYGLAGLRLGFLVSNKENIKNMQKVLSPYSVNSLAVLCGKVAIKDKKFISNYVNQIKSSKKLLYKILDEFEIEYIKSEANFVLVNFKKLAQFYCKRLKEQGILVRNRSSDPMLKGYVRITLGNKPQTEKLIEGLRNIVKELNPKLIFDIDGVLVDVVGSYRRAIKETAEYFSNKKVAMKDVQALKNKGGYNNDWKTTSALLRKKGKKVNYEDIKKEFQKFYNKYKKNERLIVNKKLLEKLNRKYDLSIVTGRPKKEADEVLQRFKIKKYFSIVIAMEDTEKPKPDPAGILKIIEKRNAYFFGDTIDDLKAAKSAKIDGIGVLPPQDRSIKLKTALMKFSKSKILTSINQLEEVIQ